MKFLRKSDIIITLVILLLDLALLFLFFSHIYANGSYSATDKLGTLIFKKRAATRKHIDAFSWNMLQNNTPVYEMDTIRTASRSEASIIFDDGSSIDLLENTLIKLNNKSAQDLGDVMQGSLVFSSKDSKKSLSIAGKTIVMDENSEVIIHKNEDGVSEVEVTKGKIEVQEDDGEQVIIEEAQSVKIDEKEEVKLEVTKISCMPLSPSHNIRLITSEDAYNIKFSWSFSTEEIASTTSTLIIAGDKECKHVIKRIAGSPSTESPSIYHADYISSLGTVYWRVEYGDGKLSSIRRYVLEKIVATELLKPTQNDTFYYYDVPPQIMFSWAKDESFSYSSILEISDNKNFSSPKFKVQVTPTLIEIPNLTEGTYYWRVYPNTNKQILGAMPEPKVRSFNIVKKEVLNDVKLKFPIDGYLCNLNVFNATGLSFTWEAKSEAERYELLLYKNKGDDEPISTISTDLPFTRLNRSNTKLFEDVGEIYFSVRYKSRRGNYSSAPTKRCVKKVNYDVNLKSLYPPDGYAISHSLMMSQRFSWKHNLPLKTFFIVARDKDFKDVVLEKENSLFAITGLNLKIGTYYWQVRVYNVDNSLFASTDAKTFHVVEPLEAPAVLSPNNNSLVPVMEDKSLDIRWQAVKYADYYEFSLYNRNGVRIAHYPNIQSTHISVPVNKYPDSLYNIELQAFTMDSNSSTRNVGYKSTSSFTSSVLTYIKLSEPQPNKRMDGLLSYKDGIKFSYKTKEKYDKLDLILKRNGRLLTHNSKHDKARQTIEIPSLASGEYEWSISAFIKGFDISSKEKRRFSVSPIPPLPAPKFIKKHMVENIDVEYLKKNRSIHFEWTPIEEASYYVIQLQNKETGQIVKTISNMKETSYDFAEIEKLNIGRFLFKVRGVALLGTKGDVRGGLEGVYSFGISLPKLKDIKVKDEEYYGY